MPISIFDFRSFYGFFIKGFFIVNGLPYQLLDSGVEVIFFVRRRGRCLLIVDGGKHDNAYEDDDKGD